MAATAEQRYAKALEIQRRQLAKLAEGRGVASIKKLYDSAEAELVAKLRKSAARGETFTAYQQRLLLAQVRQGQAQIAQRMAGDLGELSKQAQVDSLRGLVDNFNRMEKVFTGAETVLPLEEASRFWGVIDKRRSSLLRQHSESMARYGASVVGAVEKQLALSLATGETVADAIDRVEEATDASWYGAERIVRTESSFAFNATHADGIADIAKDVDDVYMRWTEHVDDDGNPLDSRVAADSLAMHGQVTRPGDGWTMPRDADDVDPTLLGKKFYSAPLRPNGREVITAWRPGWGGLAWTYKNGRRQFLSR